MWTADQLTYPTQFVVLSQTRAHYKVCADKLCRNTWEFRNFAYHKFTWQVSSHGEQYFLLANFVEEMAFCPNFKLTHSVMVDSFITLLNTSVNTILDNWVLLHNAVVKSIDLFSKSNQWAEKNIILVEFRNKYVSPVQIFLMWNSELTFSQIILKIIQSCVSLKVLPQALDCTWSVLCGGSSPYLEITKGL